MRIANVENNTLNWVSISSAGALDMTHCDFSVRDEMRHIIGSSESDVIIRSGKDQNKGCGKKDKDHMAFLCDVYEAQVARGRYFVHELVSDENHGHAQNENDSGGLVQVGISRMRRRRARICQSKCTDGHQRVDCGCEGTSQLVGRMALGCQQRRVA